MYKSVEAKILILGVQAWRSIVILTLISHSTPLTDDDQRHAVNTTLHFGRFKITIFFSPSTVVAGYPGNPVSSRAALTFIFGASWYATRCLDERVYAKGSLVQSRWRCIMNVGRGTRETASASRLDDDNKSSRERWRECLRKAPGRSMNRVLRQWAAATASW